MTRAVFASGMLALAVACATSPSPPTKSAEAPPAAPRKAPLELTGLTVAEESLQSLELVLSGELNFPRKKAPRGPLEWTARTSAGVDLGGGTAELQPDPAGNFAARLPVRFGRTVEALTPLLTEDTMDVVVTAVLGEGDQRLEASRSVRVRTPRPPMVSIVSVQASRQGNQALSLVYLLSIRNPNAFDVRASVLRYRALLADKVVSEGELPLATRIPASTESVFEIPAEAHVQNVGADLPARIRRNDLTWAFAGTVRVGGLEVPIDLSGGIRLTAQ